MKRNTMVTCAFFTGFSLFGLLMRQLLRTFDLSDD